MQPVTTTVITTTITTSQPVTPPPQTATLPGSPSSSSLHYLIFSGDEITDELLARCSKLFGANYGIWGNNPTATKMPKPGSRVKLSSARLRQQCVAVPNDTILVACFRQPDHLRQNLVDCELVGHAFATAWDYDSGQVGWVTQLVVSLEERKRYIATSLLQQLKEHPIFDGITAIGLVSSHPAACSALAKYTGLAIRSVDLTFAQANAKSILENSPVSYVKTMQLHGSLFASDYNTGAISSVFTSFYVDHQEPLEALAAYKASGNWVLGELLEGHEYLLILSTTRSTPATDVFA